MNMATATKPQPGEPLKLNNRIGELDGKFYTALGNGLTVEIAPGVCRIIDKPVMELETNLQRPQVEPMLTGNPNPFRLFEFVTVAPEEQLTLMVYPILALVPRIMKPVLEVTGKQGSGKSTLCTMLKMLIDPSQAPLILTPRTAADLDLLLSKFHVTALDNVSKLNKKMCDRLCAQVPGVVILNAINAAHSHPALLERTWSIVLEQIKANKRLTEKQLWDDFYAALPEILGGCFVTLAKAMEIHPNIVGTVPGLPFMVDAAEWSCAIAEALASRLLD